MAPRKPSDPDATKNSKTTNDGVTKPKKKYGKVRLADDGLLDVEKKGGKYKQL